MKKNRPGKRPPRLSTRILLAVLAAALAVNGYFAWQILGKPLQTEQTQTAGSVSPPCLPTDPFRPAALPGGPEFFSFLPNKTWLLFVIENREGGAAHDRTSAQQSVLCAAGWGPGRLPVPLRRPVPAGLHCAAPAGGGPAECGGPAPGDLSQALPYAACPAPGHGSFRWPTTWR